MALANDDVVFRYMVAVDVGVGDSGVGDTAACVSLWVAACASRDGIAIAGVAERARPKFDHPQCWIVVENSTGEIVAFVLVTKPGSGLATDPPDAPVVGLLAVAPDAWGRGFGGRLLAAATADLAHQGYEQAVLHVLIDHQAAVHLYESHGWRPHGESFQHSLLNRPTQAYVLNVNQPVSE